MKFTSYSWLPELGWIGIFKEEVKMICPNVSAGTAVMHTYCWVLSTQLCIVSRAFIVLVIFFNLGHRGAAATSMYLTCIIPYSFFKTNSTKPQKEISLWINVALIDVQKLTKPNWLLYFCGTITSLECFIKEITICLLPNSKELFDFHVYNISNIWY